MAGILENLDYTMEILEEEKRLFLDNRDALEKESKKLEALRPIYIKFNILYKKFSENLNDIIAANSNLEDIKRMHSRGELTDERFIITDKRIKAKIQDSYSNISENILPKLKELANEISIGSAPEEKKKKFEDEKITEIQKTEAEIKGKGVVEQAMPVLKQLFPVLIKKAVTIATGIHIP